jgi:hypothetical protein
MMAVVSDEVVKWARVSLSSVGTFECRVPSVQVSKCLSAHHVARDEGLLALFSLLHFARKLK